MGTSEILLLLVLLLLVSPILIGAALIGFLSHKSRKRMAAISATTTSPRRADFNPKPKEPAPVVPTAADKNSTQCISCHGSGRTNCTWCQGSGRKSCGSCGGSGQKWVGTSSMNPSGYGRCPFCSGGRTMCSCGGGKVVCTVCRGSGTVAQTSDSGRPRANKSQDAQHQTAQHSDGPPAIFISYRRDDSGDVTGRIYDRLVQHFGKHSVFKDVDNIPLGVDFRGHLGGSVGRCDVLLAVIGRQWLIREGERRQLHDVRDFVRIELEAALERNIPVVPVLVQGAPVPRSEDLPETLQALVYRNGIPVRADPDFHQDMDRLIKGIEGYLKERQ